MAKATRKLNEKVNLRFGKLDSPLLSAWTRDIRSSSLSHSKPQPFYIHRRYVE